MRLSAAAFVLVSLVACEQNRGSTEIRPAAGSALQEIQGGTLDNTSNNVVAILTMSPQGVGICSGSLIAPNLVLTARHCVTKNSTTSVSCDENGRSANGGHIESDEDPATIGIYAGSSPSFAKRPLALGKAIVAPQGEVLCDSDIALVVLDRDVTGITPLPLRLDAPAKVGETVRSVGYGQNDQNVPIGARFRKGGVAVLAQGKTISESRTPLGPHEFEVGKSICQGDSGGPAIAEDTGAVIGVVSRGGGCDEDDGHIYTTTSGFDAMFAQAFMLAGSGPTLESTSARPVARTTGAAPDTREEVAPTPSYASCALSPTRTRTHDSSVPLAAFGLVAAALMVCARRRSATV